ncbi:oligopeptide ABC transporter substrate-binding protein [Lactobacillus equicursoris]|uniref:oligopeptide ABC transporter substrate-binding protein n=1 Tax=Lactobacillus equicursoris TaxID=420645 RepID=UPI00242DA3A6|nr:oligopeptide ABC transporter substrate-binding protein [Lactobacillus equicursoris]MDD6386525.1 oligopeptide ABC transporter substrate-binding protein [Lactobacillus equicursoris]
MRKIRFLTVCLLAAFLLTACGQQKTSKKNTNSGAEDAMQFPIATSFGTTKKSGTIKVALETDTPFSGIFSDELADSTTEAKLAQFGSESLFDTDNSYNITDSGPAKFSLDRQAKTITITIKKGVKWSDGKQVVAKDVEYAYEVIANRATNSAHYTSSLQDVVGLKAYHDGQAKTISGIEMPDGENGRKVVIHFLAMHPGMLKTGNGYFWESAVPYHYLKNVPFKKLKTSYQIRQKPLYFGPYRVKSMVTGQSVTWVPNKYYWRGMPSLSKIVISIISPKSVATAIKQKTYDVIEVVNSQWSQIKKQKGYKFVANIPLSYTYLGFKLGTWDAKTSQVKMNKKTKMANKSLRQAIGYAMNVTEIERKYTSGLTFRIKTLIPAEYGDYYNDSLDGYPYSPKKAEELLDKAGYKRKKGEKYRRDPQGHKLTIHLAAMTGDSSQVKIINNYIKMWRKIGLHVTLTSGSLMEFNTFYSLLFSDDSQVDMFIAGWSLNDEPSQNGIYGSGTQYNLGRFATDKNTKLINEMDSEKSFNLNYRIKVFKEWQEYMQDQAYVIPLTSSYRIMAINKNLLNYSLESSQENNNHPLWYKVGFKK